MCATADLAASSAESAAEGAPSGRSGAGGCSRPVSWKRVKRKSYSASRPLRRRRSRASSAARLCASCCFTTCAHVPVMNQCTALNGHGSLLGNSALFDITLPQSLFVSQACARSLPDTASFTNKQPLRLSAAVSTINGSPKLMRRLVECTPAPWPWPSQRSWLAAAMPRACHAPAPECLAPSGPGQCVTINFN